WAWLPSWCHCHRSGGSTPWRPAGWAHRAARGRPRALRLSARTNGQAACAGNGEQRMNWLLSQRSLCQSVDGEPCRSSFGPVLPRVPDQAAAGQLLRGVGCPDVETLGTGLAKPGLARARGTVDNGYRPLLMSHQGSVDGTPNLTP